MSKAGKIKVLFPHLYQELDRFSNKGIDLDGLTSGSNAYVWWRCVYGHSWKAQVYNRVKGTGCPYCSGNAISDNSLQKKQPDLASQFCKIKNDLSPDEISFCSNKKVWWKCSKADDHVWKATPNDRNKASGCPFCSGRRASKDNNLLDKYPEIANQWHPTKNGALTPSDLTPASGKKVWWKCKVASDHEWLASPNTRINMTNSLSCPFCTGRKVCNSNCLSTTHEFLLDSWDFKKNEISPTEITYSSHKKIWWICDKKHSWCANVYSRSAGKGCQQCNLSKGEAKVAKVLSDMGMYFQKEYRFKKSKIPRRKFDFAVFNQSIHLIEYHGIQHYEPVSFGSKTVKGQQTLKRIQHRDQLKREWVLDNGYPLLEIPYWDFDQIEHLIRDFLYERKKDS